MTVDGKSAQPRARPPDKRALAVGCRSKPTDSRLPEEFPLAAVGPAPRAAGHYLGHQHSKACEVSMRLPTGPSRAMCAPWGQSILSFPAPSGTGRFLRPSEVNGALTSSAQEQSAATGLRFPARLGCRRHDHTVFGPRTGMQVTIVV